jgi:sulfur relay (sulfurtransferase) DsrC/TusE family protein
LLKAQIVPVLNYAANSRWKFLFAPHELGNYPQANGQVYGGGEVSEHNQMPVEECGNMLILTAAVCKAENKIDLADQHWEILLKWVNYLVQFDLDPKNQLCTNNFAGHLAHNANLALKAIVAIAAFGELCQLRADKTQSQVFHQIAQNMATEWLRLADDGDHHYRLAFNRKESWNQKYNLVWQQLFGFNLFPSSVAQK